MAEQEEKRIIVKVAYNYFQSGNWDRALDEYKKLIAIDPMDFLVHNMLAEIYARKGDQTEAIREYLHAASLLRATNNMEKALQAYSRILKLDPNSEEAKTKIEEVIRVRMVEVDELAGRGAYKQAREVCERLLERLPDHPVLTAKLAEIEKRQLAQPVPPISRAVKLPPQPAAPAPAAPASEGVMPREDVVKNLYAMAELFEKKQSWDEAVEAYITIIRFHPEDEGARGKLHALYRKITRADKASEVWARISAEDKRRIEHAKKLAKATAPARPAGPEPAPGEAGSNTAEMDKLRQQAEEKLRQAVEDRRERDRSQLEVVSEDRPAETGGQSDQEVNVLLTQAYMVMQQGLLIEAMRLCQRILELEPANQEVRGLLQKIFEKKKL